MGIINTLIIVLIAIVLSNSGHDALAKNLKSITLTPIGRYNAGGGIERAEIAAYDPATRRVFAINPAQSRLDVLDLSRSWNFSCLLSGGLIALRLKTAWSR